MVDLLDQVGPGDRKVVVVADLPLPAEVAGREVGRLDLGAHRAVEQHWALGDDVEVGNGYATTSCRQHVTGPER